MRARCNDPEHDAYPYYGGRGIKVCKEWQESFDNFLRSVGIRPAGRTLDRIDPNGDYVAGNVRWATAQEQRNNRRHAA